MDRDALDVMPLRGITEESTGYAKPCPSRHTTNAASSV